MKTVVIDGVKMTFHEAHQHLWNWLAINLGGSKIGYFHSHDVSILPSASCFACEASDGDCEFCPIVKWRKNGCTEFTDFNGRKHIGLYKKWSELMYDNRFEEACEIARQIADLEWEEVAE